MRRIVTTFSSLAVAAGALVFAACSDSTTSPPGRGLSASDPSLSVTPGTNSLTIVSDASTQYCASAQLNGGNNAIGDWNIPASFAPVAGCATAVDLQLPAGTSPLDTYNPGWSSPFSGSHWIGITTKGGPSSDYRPNPGRYVFQESFSVPANVTGASLDMHVKSDNVAAVYLNGTQIGAQANTDCNVGTCNWNSDLHITASLTAGTAYTLTFVVSDLPTGFPSTTTQANGGFGGPSPQYGCPTRPFQPTGSHLFTNDHAVNTSPNHVIAGGGAGTSMTNIGLANQAGCENPMGLDFAGTVTWTPVVSTIWCSPGFWKNHLDAWSTTLQNQLYNAHGPYPNAPQTFVGYDFGKKVGSSNPTMVQVISNPSIYGGPATNNVASYISNQLFGTPMTANPTENCPDVLPVSGN